MMINFLLIITALALVLLNALFVAAEFGMVKLRNTRVEEIKELYGLRGKILNEIHHQLDAYLSACQVGITLASLGLGWIGEPAFASLLHPIFHALGILSDEMITIIAFLLAFSFISFLHIVIGELVPKSLAIRRPESVSLWTAIPLYAFYWLMYPAIWLLNTCSFYILRKTGLATTQDQNFYSTDELRLILSGSHLHGELTREETEIIEHTLEFADLRVTEIMRPDHDMIVLNLSDSTDTNFDKIMRHRFSRYPVYDKEKNEIIGIIHVKDLFAALYKHESISNLKNFLRPIIKINYRTSALSLLNLFREGTSHFALVYKNKETLLGFITLDNLLHIIIGRIKDEFHLTAEDWIRNADGSISISGESSIYALERALEVDISLDDDEKDIDILGGLIVTRLGRLPQVGEKVSFAEFEAIIQELEGHKIKKMLVYPVISDSKN